MINGQEPDTTVDLVRAAQKRLGEACMAQAMSKDGCTISAYVNGVINGAGLQALIEFSTEEDPPTNLSRSERFLQLLIKNLSEKAQVLENTAKEAPRILTGLAGHG